MWRRISISLLLAVCAGAKLSGEEAAPPSPSRGLMPTRTQNPLFLLFFRMSPTGADIPAAGRGSIELSSSYTSFFEVDAPLTDTFAILDGELWRNVVRARLGLGRSLALELAIPALYGGGGFLDPYIEGYHDVFGFNQNGRDENPDDRFDFVLATRGTLAYELPENELGLGDTSVTLDWLARRESARAPAVLLRVGMELPTGDEERGFGNGHIDGGVGVALTKRLGAYHLHADLAYHLQAQPDTFEQLGVGVRDTWAADVGAERPVGPRTSLVAQLGFEESPIDGVALPAVGDNSATILLGVAVRVARQWTLDASFIENLDGASTQDFTAHMGLRYLW